MVICASNIPREVLGTTASIGDYTLRLHALCSVLISCKRTMLRASLISWSGIEQRPLCQMMPT
jgi:hypothetical protein